MEQSISSLGTQLTERPRSMAESFCPERPKLLFMGPRSGGKSSIREVVFHKLQPDQTLHIETTRKITQDDIKSFIDFEIWDLPGPLESDLINLPFSYVGAVIFVIDAQSSYLSTIPQLALALIQAYEANPSLHFEIFMHKIDAVTPDYRNEIIEQFKDRLADELSDRELSMYCASSVANEIEHRITYKLTTVFDYSIYDALSRVIMKIIPHQAALEQLMNILAQQSGVENCILFDTWTKLYIATDSSPTEKPLLEMCTELMDIFTDLSELYGVPQQISPVTRPNPMANAVQRRSDSVNLQKLSSSRGTSRTREISPSNRLKSSQLNSSSTAGPSSSSKNHDPLKSSTTSAETDSSDRGQRFMTSHVRLDTNFGDPQLIDQPGKVISYFEINQYLTLVCITNEEIMRTQGTLIEYNVSRVRESIQKIFEINKRNR
ncbi:Gtr1/RagA G protein conserved region-domain-containing protein [Phakopsora pachyrhizi]|uniref:GTP-binding protein n=1 Tax=Phakopsora pachyrhizi TaxID=170000 RepID=A0AAV0B016_PHAPC|nr:Gtr1/RagA G protein conserved region-domain-containing protein [Phakopsora pachyrhizi]CAH7674580.1 Gtr1/RagA G protein conserved region-domain-containing protein [Phakopsora pachyrhizi]